MSPRSPRSYRSHGSDVSRPALTLAAAVLGCLAVSGCVAAEPEGATFVVPSVDAVPCQEHQEVGPSPAYAGDADSDTVAMLELLRYWQENGDKPYCDGEPPTEVDLQWQQTVDRLLAPADAPAPSDGASVGGPGTAPSSGPTDPATGAPGPTG